MADQNAIEILNRLLTLHSRSLPTYLASARPWFPRSGSEAEDVLRHIAEDQHSMVDRIGAVVLDLGGTVAPSEFPMEFASMHDLSGDFLVRQVAVRQQREIEWMRQCVQSLNGHPAARAIAEESLGAAQAHADSLEELMGQGSAGA